MFNKLLVTFFGIGNIKFAPGTIASFISLILLLILNYYITKPTFILIFIFLLIISFLFVKEYILELKTKDSQEIVIDEVLGIYLILILIKIDYEMVIPSFIIIILLFRFFDIAKIFPMNLIEKKYDNAFGIIADDLIAGLYTVVLYLILQYLLHFTLEIT